MIRWLTAIVLMVFLLALLVFALENMAVIDVRFLSSGFRVPTGAVIVGSYLLGMLTGSTVFGFLRRSVRTIQERRPKEGA